MSDEKRMDTAMLAENDENTAAEENALVMKLDKPFTFEGQTYTEVDLSGLEDTTAADLQAVGRFVTFLSTPSARRATIFVDLDLLFINNFYPRPPRGGRHHLAFAGTSIKRISIHALREEGDLLRPIVEPDQTEFLSTPSARRATSFRLVMMTVPLVFLSTPSARRATTGCRRRLPRS